MLFDKVFRRRQVRILIRNNVKKEFHKTVKC